MEAYAQAGQKSIKTIDQVLSFDRSRGNRQLFQKRWSAASAPDAVCRGYPGLPWVTVRNRDDLRTLRKPGIFLAGEAEFPVTRGRFGLTKRRQIFWATQTQRRPDQGYPMSLGPVGPTRSTVDEHVRHKLILLCRRSELGPGLGRLFGARSAFSRTRRLRRLSLWRCPSLWPNRHRREERHECLYRSRRR